MLRQAAGAMRNLQPWVYLKSRKFSLFLQAQLAFALNSLEIHKGFLRLFALNPACACEISVIFFVFRYTLSIRSAHGVVNRSAQDEFQAAPVQDIQKCGLNFGQFNALTFSALARIIKDRQVNLSVRVTVRSGMSIRGKAAMASLWFLCPFSFSQKLRHGSGGVRRCRL